MKLPWRSVTRSTTAAPEKSPEEVVPSVETHRSPGLDAIIEGRSLGDDAHVLDLGPAVPENVEFLAGFARRIELVDAVRGSLDVGPALGALKKLGRTHRRSFHLVLMWDYLNYLPTGDCEKLVAAVAPLCRPGARCLAMVFTSDTMPAHPRKYRIVDGSHLAYESSTDDVVGAPRLTPAALERMLAGFNIDHAFVLRNGIREYVATRDLGGAKDPG